MANLSPEDLEILVKLTLDDQAKLTADQNAENKAKMEALMADPSIMEGEMAEAFATFDAADTNSNGLLNETEWLDFVTKSTANGKAKGWHTADVDVEEVKVAYGAYLRACGSADGIPKD